MKHMDFGNFEHLVLQLWSTCSVRGKKDFFAHSLFSFLITCGKVITCGRKINDEGVTAAIRWEIPVNRASDQFNIPRRT